MFEPGFLQVVLAYHDAGALPPGTLVKLYFAAGGYLTRGRPLWGVPPIPEGLDLYLAMLGDTGHPLGDRGRRRRRVRRRRSPGSRSSAAGTSGSASRTTRTRRATVELVERAAALCADVGRPVATLAEAADDASASACQLADELGTRDELDAVAGEQVHDALQPQAGAARRAPRYSASVRSRPLPVSTSIRRSAYFAGCGTAARRHD